MTPSDDMAFVGQPGLFRPEADEVHISVTFTWDIEKACRMSRAWCKHYPVVRVGGPAFDERGGAFKAGRYLCEGVTITSRGCPNRCRWCLVKTPFRELKDIQPGHIIQDDNILAGSRKHLKRVAKMLEDQPKAARFSGGLEARRLTDWHADWLGSLRIREAWFAADSWAAHGDLEKVWRKVGTLGRQKLRCYVLVGFGGESPEEAHRRLEIVWAKGFLPFAQLYQGTTRHDYDAGWKALAREWSRPAIMYANHPGQGDRE